MSRALIQGQGRRAAQILAGQADVAQFVVAQGRQRSQFAARAQHAGRPEEDTGETRGDLRRERRRFGPFSGDRRNSADGEHDRPRFMGAADLQSPPLRPEEHPNSRPITQTNVCHKTDRIIRLVLCWTPTNSAPFWPSSIRAASRARPSACAKRSPPSPCTSNAWRTVLAEKL